MIYSTPVRVDTVSYIITMFPPDAAKVSSSTMRVLVTLALDHHYELLRPEFVIHYCFASLGKLCHEENIYTPERGIYMDLLRI